MLRGFRRIFDDGSTEVRAKIIGLYAFLFAANIGGWIWAIAAFHNSPVLIGTSLLAWAYGLRHAVDADHIAAIDNVTRKLMQEGKRPITVGFFFAMGHSLVLVIGVAAIVVIHSTVNSAFNNFNDDSGIIGTMVSTTFLLLIGIMNLMIAISVYRTFRYVRRKTSTCCSTSEVSLPAFSGRCSKWSPKAGICCRSGFYSAWGLTPSPR
jgi:high-affinity nickel-transport protein